MTTATAPEAPSQTPAQTPETPDDWEIQDQPEPPKPVLQAGSEPSVPAEPQPPATPPKHNLRTLALAAQLGIPDAEIANLPPDRLDDAVYFLTQQRLSQPPVAQAPQPVLPPAEEPLVIDWGTDTDGRALTEQDVAPGLAHVIKNQAKELRDLKKQFSQSQQNQQARSFADQVDDVFAKMPRYTALLGTGTINALPANSPELARRQAIVERAGKLAGTNARHDQVLAMLDRAAQDLYGFALKPGEPVLPTGDEKAKLETAYIQQHAHAPTTQRRSEAELTTEQKALQTIKRTMNAKGYDTTIQEDLDHQNLPD